MLGDIGKLGEERGGCRAIMAHFSLNGAQINATLNKQRAVAMAKGMICTSIWRRCTEGGYLIHRMDFTLPQSNFVQQEAVLLIGKRQSNHTLQNLKPRA